MQTSGGGSGRRESAPALLAGYENLLAHLKSQGALLNAVKPELLLDITDFRCAAAAAAVLRAIFRPDQALACCLLYSAPGVMLRPDLCQGSECDIQSLVPCYHALLTVVHDSSRVCMCLLRRAAHMHHIKSCLLGRIYMCPDKTQWLNPLSGWYSVSAY